MAHFLLIHGTSHGAWCWRDVLPELAALGHTAQAIDLPSHGDDPTPPEGVTLDDYGRAIIAAIDEPVILVGHSMGGYPITLAAEMAPEKVAGLMYLCAYTPWAGLGLADMRKCAASQPLREAIRISQDRRTMTLDPDMVEAKFYHDCPPETLDYARPRLSVQAVAPMEIPVDLAHAPTLPRGYIICNDDRAVPPDMQREMAARLLSDHIFEINSAHSPFFACPAKLARILDTFADQIVATI